MKRGYFVYSKGEDWGIPIVARTFRNAKSIAYMSWPDICYPEWTDLVVTWKQNASVESLEYGVVNERDALRCGIYDWVDDELCDLCGKYARVELYKNKIVCTNCINNMEK